MRLSDKALRRVQAAEGRPIRAAELSLLSQSFHFYPDLSPRTDLYSEPYLVDQFSF